MLTSYDDSEVRRIVAMCEQCTESVHAVSKATAVDEIIQHLRPACQNMVDLVAVAGERVKELLFDTLQTRLGRAVDELSNNSTLIVTASKAVAANPQDHSALKSRRFICEQLVDCVKTIEEVVQIVEYTGEADVVNLTAQRKDAQHQLVQLMTAVMEGDANAVLNFIEAYEFTSGLLLEDARGIPMSWHLRLFIYIQLSATQMQASSSRKTILKQRNSVNLLTRLSPSKSKSNNLPPAQSKPAAKMKMLIVNFTAQLPLQWIPTHDSMYYVIG